MGLQAKKIVQGIGSYSFAYISSCGGKQCKDSQAGLCGIGQKGWHWVKLQRGVECVRGGLAHVALLVLGMP